MIRLLLAALLLPLGLGAAYAPGTLGLYDFEQNLSGTASTNHGTPAGTLVYQSATGVWHGLYAVSGTAGLTLPTAVVATSGTLEFTIRTGDGLANSTALWSVDTSGSTRRLEMYYFSGNFYLFSSPHAVNVTVVATAVSTNYYVKVTWDGTNTAVWVGTWTVPGTVTLTRRYNEANSIAMGSPTVVHVLKSSVNAGISGAFDWMRWRNVYDNSADVTIDPTDSILSPYMKNSNRLDMTPPRMLRWFLLGMPKEAKAMHSDSRIEQANNMRQWEKERDNWVRTKATKTPTPQPTATPSGPKPTATRTPIK